MANQLMRDQTMDDALSLILRGCSSARDLQLTLSNTPNPHPDVLSKSCDDIIAIFTAAKERLSAISDYRPRPPSTGFEEWLRSTCTQAMELAQMQIRAGVDISRPSEQKVGGGLQLPEVVAAGSAPAMADFGGGLGFLQSEHDSGKLMGMGSSSSSQKPRRRKAERERTVRVAVPRIGNTELPPDDGFTWRKYGQKEILGSRFPRGYFRCTHQKLYNCPAKKHVQRLDDDPFTFEIIYRGDHICHMSSTAPSVAPPQQFPTAFMALSRCLSVEFSATGSGSGGSGSGAGPSAARYGKEVDQFPVLDMADAMFNSGSCSSNSMDSIFPACVVEEDPQHQKWEREDTKN